MVSMSHLSLHVHSAGVAPPAPSKPSFAMPLFTLPLPPKARQLVQAFSAEDVSEDTYIYELVRCGLCQQIHRVNPATGAVLGHDDEKATPQKQP